MGPTGVGLPTECQFSSFEALDVKLGFHGADYPNAVSPQFEPFFTLEEEVTTERQFVGWG